MKYYLFIFICISISSCTQECESIIGKWRVDSPFYKASIDITNSDGSLKCAILTYDDGTTRHDNRNKTPYYLASNLKCKEGIYIDGVSGATPLVDQGLKIDRQAFDTLLITSYIMNKPLTEKWIKYDNETK